MNGMEMLALPLGSTVLPLLSSSLSLSLSSPLLSSVQDTVAFVTKPGGLVDHSRYMWAGYIVTAVVYIGYAVLLQRRIARTRRGR